MAGNVKWLERYYGKEFDFLNPQIVHEGENKAVVRLTRVGDRGYSGIGYVLIDKNGNHFASSPVSLHEGVPSQKDLDRMKEVLKAADK